MEERRNNSLLNYIDSMNKSNVIKIIIIIASITILVFIWLIILLKKEERNNAGTVVPEKEYIAEEIEGEIIYKEKELFYQDYKIIKNCLQTYIDTININNSTYYGFNENNEYTKVVDEQNIKENIYNLLSKNYIDNNNITIENIYNHIDTVKENKIVIPIEIKDNTYNQEGENVKKYSVSALVMSMENKEDFNYLYCILNMDKMNYTFSIEPVKDKSSLEKFEIKYVMNSIEENNLNTFTDVGSTEEQIVQDYFKDFKNILLSDIELAYNYLDSNYKEKRFKNQTDFENYVRNNKEMLERIRLEKWNAKEHDNYTQYSSIDQYGNYYIFREIETMNYTVILDTYTLDLPEFIEKYNSTNEQGKVALNIQKFMQSIDSKDYNYAYNCLSEGFRQNYFKTVDEFKKYAEENFYNKNLVTYKEFEEEGGLYKYTVTIDNEEYQEEIKTKTFIVKLNEGTNFEMSFNID